MTIDCSNVNIYYTTNLQESAESTQFIEDPGSEQLQKDVVSGNFQKDEVSEQAMCEKRKVNEFLPTYLGLNQPENNLQPDHRFLN